MDALVAERVEGLRSRLRPASRIKPGLRQAEIEVARAIDAQEIPVPDVNSLRRAGEDDRRRDVWDAAAADYDACAEPFTRQFAEAALQLAGGVQRGERVLDVAAGTSALTLAVARAGAQVLATDFSPGMVARLSEHLVEAGLGQWASAQVMDGQALSLADASFDAAFSIFGIMIFPNGQQGLAELARVVRPGRRGVVAVWASEEGAGPAPSLTAAQRIAFPDRPCRLRHQAWRGSRIQ
ncbi:MAG TPA: methyltransferase domain-containing protein [Microvirga sp.]|nr:methyltransferase domain-containing protein [Microvirga sp.]